MMAYRPLLVTGDSASRTLKRRWIYASIPRNMSLSLREYAKRFKRSLRAIAIAAGVDDADIYGIADGKKGWSDATAAKIKKATDGRVTANDLLKVRAAYLAQLEREESRARAAARKKSAPRPTREVA